MTPVSAEQHASELRKRSRSSHPVHLFSIGRSLGVASIESEDITTRGCALYEGGTWRIVLRNGMSPTRRRFVLAHELAHVWLSRRDSASMRDEELCDDIAGHLLVPDRILKGLQDDGAQLQLESLIEAARTSRCSPATVASSAARRLGLPIWLIKVGLEDPYPSDASTRPAGMNGLVRIRTALPPTRKLTEFREFALDVDGSRIVASGGAQVVGASRSFSWILLYGPFENRASAPVPLSCRLAG
jgi:hypothetical protein